MNTPTDGTTLAFVDRVLEDLQWQDGMFVGRRLDAAEPGVAVIQSGEEGRYRVALPDLGSIDSVWNFVEAVQSHLTQLYGRPVPACPLHDHCLVFETQAVGLFEWGCPDVAWRCAVGTTRNRLGRPRGCRLEAWPPPYRAG